MSNVNLRNDYFQNFNDTVELLDRSNIDQEKLINIAKESADWATDNKIALEFSKNRHDKEDVAIFDFTAMHQALHSCLVKEENESQLLQCIVGDTLIEVDLYLFLT